MKLRFIPCSLNNIHIHIMLVHFTVKKNTGHLIAFKKGISIIHDLVLSNPILHKKIILYVCIYKIIESKTCLSKLLY